MPTPLRHRPGRYRAVLEGAGFLAIDPPGLHRLSEDDLVAALPEVDALLAGGDPVTARMIAAAPRLRAIARVGVGYESVDLAAATARRVAVTITPGANHESVAEHVFAMLLALTRDLFANDRMVRGGGWERRPVRPLRGTTLGVAGLGRIGRVVADRGAAFGMSVVAFDRNGDRTGGPRRVGFGELLALSDAVCVCLPFSADTQGLFDRKAFAAMRPGAVLINAARGGLVVEADLAEALQSGHLAGAGLDVLDSEPPRRDNPLLGLPNVVFSPHVAGVDTRALDDMAEQAALTLIALARGEWPQGSVINEELRADWRWS